MWTKLIKHLSKKILQPEGQPGRGSHSEGLKVPNGLSPSPCQASGICTASVTTTVAILLFLLF